MTGAWTFFLYPLEPTAVSGDWIGLSEITQLGGDRFAVIERDKQFGSAARLKRVYAFSLDGLVPFDGPVPEGTTGEQIAGSVIRKALIADVVEEFAPFEKVEGLTVTRSGKLWACLDNDGGGFEPRLVRVDRLDDGPGHGSGDDTCDE